MTDLPPPAASDWPASADVVIVGAGIIGASAAWHLAAAEGVEAPPRIVVVERAHRMAGSTARSAAAFRHQFSSASNIQMSLRSGRAYEEFPANFGTEPVFKQNGYLFLFSDGESLEHARGRVARQKAAGVPQVEILSPAQIARQFPWLKTEGLAGASWCPRDGFIVPDVVTHAWLDGALARGARLLQQAAVTEIRRESGRVAGVVLNGRHEIRTPVVVNCAGPWSNAVARTAGVEIPVVPVKRYLYVTNQFGSRDVTGFPMTVVDMEQYCRPEHQGLMLGWDLRPEKPEGWGRFPPPACDYAGLNDDIGEGFGLGVEGYGYEILAGLAERMPFLETEAGLDHVTCGYYEITPDEKAILGWDPRVPGLLHATGFSGHGVMHAPAAGQLVRDFILGRPSFMDPSPMAPDKLLRNEPREDPELMVI